MIEWKPYIPGELRERLNHRFLVSNGYWVAIATLNELSDGENWGEEWLGDHGNIEGVTHYAEINTPNQQLAVKSSTTAAALAGALIQIRDAFADEYGGQIGEKEMRIIARRAIAHNGDKVERRRWYIDNLSPYRCPLPGCGKPTITSGQYCSAECGVAAAQWLGDHGNIEGGGHIGEKEMRKFIARRAIAHFDTVAPDGECEPQEDDDAKTNA